MTTFSINVRGVQSLAESLVTLTGERLGAAALRGVNETAVRFEESAIRGELANIELSRAYVKSKTDLQLAQSSAAPQATITTERALTPLGRFGNLVAFRQPGAPRRAGPVKGQRSAGVYVNIKTSDRLQEGQWFVLPLRRGDVSGGNGYGAFVRTSALAGKGRNGPGDGVRHRDGRFGKQQIYGPSPGALFAKQIELQGDDLRKDLEQTVVSAVLAAVNEGLK